MLGGQQHKKKETISYMSRLDSHLHSIELKATVSHKRLPRQETAQVFTESETCNDCRKGNTQTRASELVGNLQQACGAMWVNGAVQIRKDNKGTASFGIFPLLCDRHCHPRVIAEVRPGINNA